MTAVARKHHYLPQFYLKGFSSETQEQIWVLDLNQKRWFKTSIKNIGTVRDFNRINIPNVPLDRWENELANSFEKPASDILKDVIRNNYFPPDHIFVYLLNLTALFAARNPEIRLEYEKAIDKQNENALNRIFGSRDEFEKIKQRIIEKGNQEIQKYFYEEMLAFFQSKNYRYEVPTKLHIQKEVFVMSILLKEFSNLNWAIFYSEFDNHQFICSDRPVAIVGGKLVDQADQTLELNQVGTEVTLPMSKNHCLIGSLKDIDGKVLRATPKSVAQINARTLGYAYKQVYSSRNSFMAFINSETVSSDYFVNRDIKREFIED